MSGTSKRGNCKESSWTEGVTLFFFVTSEQCCKKRELDLIGEVTEQGLIGD